MWGKRGGLQKRAFKWMQMFIQAFSRKILLKSIIIQFSKILFLIFSFSTLSVQFYSWAPPACPLAVIYLIMFLIKKKAKTRITFEVECLTAIEIKSISGLKLAFEFQTHRDHKKIQKAGFTKNKLHPLIYSLFRLNATKICNISLKDL